MKNNLYKPLVIIYIVLLIASSLCPKIISSTFGIINFTTDKFNIAVYFLAGLYPLMQLFRNEKWKRKYSLIVMFAFALLFHHFYMSSCDDGYVIAFMWAKEIITIFIVCATNLLLKSSGKYKTNPLNSKVLFVSLFSICLLLAASLCFEGYAEIHAGFYPLILSIITYAILNFVAFHEEQRKENEKMIDETVDISEFYMYANYMGGLPDDNGFIENIAVILDKEDKRELRVIVYSDLASPHRIEYSRIKRIECRLVDYREPKTKLKDTEFMKQIMLGKILDNLSPFAASDDFRTRLDLYMAFKPNVVMQIGIVYEYKKEDRYLEFYAKRDYQTFLGNLSEHVPFPIDKIAKLK